jgi:CRISPR-associated protein Csb2
MTPTQARLATSPGLGCGILRPMWLAAFVGGDPQDVTHALRVATTFRKAVLASATDPGLEVINGHASRFAATKIPHLMFLPIGTAGPAEERIRLSGVLVVPPAGAVSEQLLTELDCACGRISRLNMGHHGQVRMQTRFVDNGPSGDIPRQFVGAAKRWRTMTPMVFDRFPKGLDHPHAQAIVAMACVDVGFPVPKRIYFDLHKDAQGIPPAREFPTLSTRGKPIFWNDGTPSNRDEYGNPARLRSHVVLEFSDPVSGPLAIGAGRHLGLGTCFHESDPVEPARTAG